MAFPAALRCCLPLYRKRRLPQRKIFRGSITRPIHSLSTLRGLGYPSTFPPRKTRFWLLASFARRGWLPAGSHCKVSGCLCHPSSSHQLPGAPIGFFKEFSAQSLSAPKHPAKSLSPRRRGGRGCRGKKKSRLPSQSSARAGWVAARALRARATLARISLAEAVQMNGFGAALWFAM